MPSNHCSPSNTALEQTDFGYTFLLINGKYKMIVMYWLSLNAPVMRFNELKRCIGSISYKTLSNTLKDLERDKIVVRKEYPQIPPKVEYALTERGKSLMPILDLMCHWGSENRIN